MRIPTNKISSIINFFHTELHGLYENGEIETFVLYALEFYLGFARTDLLLKQDQTVSESELLKLNAVVKQLKSGEPIQYILSEADFYGMKFNVNKNVLIPRPETEELVHLVINENKGSGKKLHVLDIGTGSGCIAITLKKHLENSNVSVLDISDEAIAMTRVNAAKNNVTLTYLSVNIFIEQLVERPTFDIIVSNPPYIRLSEKAQMNRNVTEWEPHQALFVENNDPLLFYKAIADTALIGLFQTGKLYLEINEAFGKEVAELLENKGFNNVVVIKDINGKDRIVKCSL